jgi:hypothetical protein
MPKQQTEASHAVATPGAAASRARRYRRLRLFLLIPFSIVFIVSALIGDATGLFTSQLAQMLFCIVFGTAILVLGAWNRRVLCPRCGWNIYFRKTNFPLLATTIPSSCPNCGLDLER